MRIFYTTKRIFWSNEGQDYLEDTQFNEFFSGQWIELSNVKSINWTSHYEASFYATDAFDATYFKIEKNNQSYYFFVQDIKNDSANGKFWYLTLDLYNTYGLTFVQTMQAYNPPVSFKRKHCNRYFRSNNPEKKFCFDFNRQRYLLTPPSTLADIANNVNNYPTYSTNIKLLNSGRVESLLEYQVAVGRPLKRSRIEFRPNERKHYEYLVLKRPGTIKYDTLKHMRNWSFDFTFVLIEELVNINDIYPIYVGTFYSPDGSHILDFGGSDEHYIMEIPSDLVVARIRTSVPPCVFRAFAGYGELYPTKQDDITLRSIRVFMGPRFVDLPPENDRLFFSMPDTEEYSLPSHEPIFQFQPFLNFKINGSNELSSLSFFKRNPNKSGTFIVTNTNNWTVCSSSSFFIRPARGALEHDSQLQYFIEATYKKPAYGDVLNNYLLNNANALSTGIQNKIGTAALGVFGGGINALSSIRFNPYGTAISGLGIGQSIWGLAQSTRNYIALKADLGNRVDDVKDVYGKGAVVEDDQTLVVSQYTLPPQIKQLVFKDIYFNGYEFNGVDNFNSYRNRTKFNYFEITDINQFLNLYTTYPKQIISDLSEKFMNGIRLWRTTAVNFDMSLDNREISFD